MGHGSIPCRGSMRTMYVLKRSDGRYYSAAFHHAGWTKDLYGAELYTKDRAQCLKGKNEEIVAIIERRKEAGMKGR
jgi:hypothetical protein